MDSVAIVFLVVGFVVMQLVYLLVSHLQHEKNITLIREICDSVSESRRADHRDNLAADRLVGVLIEKLQCNPAWAAERHLRERVTSEANQARVMAEEVRYPPPPPTPAPQQTDPYENGVHATSLEAARE